MFELSSTYLMSVCYYILNWLRNYERTEMTHFQRHWLFVNMPFTKEDKILMKNLFELKATMLGITQRVSQKKLKCQQRLQVVAIAMGYWLIDRRPGNGR